MAKPFSSELRLSIALSLNVQVDPEDEWLLTDYTWGLSNKGYIRTTVRLFGMKYTISMHHLIMGTPIYPDEMIDHQDRNKRNNRRSNLRWTDGYGNSHNSDRTDNASLISFHKPTDKYVCRIMRFGTEHWLGRFATQREAENARDEYLRQNRNLPSSN